MTDERTRSWWRNGLWVLALAVLAFFLLRPAGIRVIDAQQAPQASPLQLRSLDGRTFELDSFRDQVVLLNLWASWCGPCRAEIPTLARLDERFGSEGLVVLGVNVESLTPAEVAGLGARLGISYRTAQPAGPLRGTFEGEGVLPQTWLIDRSGRVRASHGGLASESSLTAACRKLLDEAPGS